MLVPDFEAGRPAVRGIDLRENVGRGGLACRITRIRIRRRAMTEAALAGGRTAHVCRVMLWGANPVKSRKRPFRAQEPPTSLCASCNSVPPPESCSQRLDSEVGVIDSGFGPLKEAQIQGPADQNLSIVLWAVARQGRARLPPLFANQ